MEQQKYKWLFFDMGGVLLNDDKPEHLRQEALLQVTQKYLPGTTMNDVKNAWMIASKNQGSLRMEALKILFQDSPYRDKASEEYKNICTYNYHELSHIRPVSEHVLFELSKKFNLGIMANQTEKTHKLLADTDLLPYLSHQKMSAHIGLEKPDPEFFKAVFQDTGARAEESVIIDDNWYRGLLPAKQLGMTTVLYKRDIVSSPRDADPDYTITRLEDLLSIFT